MKGKVFFVGAGPGALDLLTVRAVRVLQHADIVLHDELVPHDFVQLLPPATRILNVGKRCGRPGTSQDAINLLLVRHAREGHRVVRLKCGDPSLFGRLGEEIEALCRAGIAFEIVPGVTAAVAGAAAARISLTDRRIASRLVFAAGTLADGKSSDWRKCIEEKTTLVIYMPGQDYNSLAARLRGAGAPAHLPCAVIARAGAVDEEVLRTTVSGLPDVHMSRSPAIVIIGDVVRQVVNQDGPLSLSNDAVSACETREDIWWHDRSRTWREQNI